MSDDFQSPPPAPPAAPPVAGGDTPSDTGKLLAALGWIFWPIAIVAILLEPYKNEKFVRHHAIQSLGFNVVVYVASFVLSFVLVGVFVGLAAFIYAVILAVQAWNGKMTEVPLVYNLVKQYI